MVEAVPLPPGSLFGAVFGCDHHGVSDNAGVSRPIRRDVEGVLRLLARNRLRGSVRLARAVQALSATISLRGGGPDDCDYAIVAIPRCMVFWAKAQLGFG